MKFVAAHTFLNVKGLSITPDAKQVHEYPETMTHQPDKAKPPGMIVKGMRFSIGTAEKADDLTPEEKTKILWLVKGHPRSVQAVAADDKAVERIDREVKEDIRKHKEERKPQATMAEMIASAVASALAEAGLIKAKA